MRWNFRLWTRYATLPILMIVLVAFYQDCAPHKPHTQGSQFMSATFTHTGKENSCASCHEVQRPKSTDGWSANTWSTSSSTFNLADHGLGNDCLACHQATQSQNTFSSMANWIGGNYSHIPSPATCINCHSIPISANSPSLSGTGLTFQDHSAMGTQDCRGCHTSPANYTSISGWGGASDFVPAGQVNGSGSSWNFWSVSNTVLKYTQGASLGTATASTNMVQIPQQMFHTSNQVPASLLNNCTTCHKTGQSASSGTRFHASISDQPVSNCISCHSPAGLPSGIVGPTTGSTDPANMNHAAVAGQDCASCHLSGVGTSWKGAMFHANSNGSSVADCTSCHYLIMPKTPQATGTIYTPAGSAGIPQHFSHTDGVVTQNCTSCHTQSGPPNTWITSQKIHGLISPGSISKCNACHSSDAPSATTRMPSSASTDSYVHAAGISTEDCASCHAVSGGSQWIINRNPTIISAPSNTTGTTWSGGLYDHKAGVGKVMTCTPCHSGYASDDHQGFPNIDKSQAHAYEPCMACH